MRIPRKYPESPGNPQRIPSESPKFKTISRQLLGEWFALNMTMLMTMVMITVMTLVMITVMTMVMQLFGMGRAALW